MQISFSLSLMLCYEPSHAHHHHITSSPPHDPLFSKKNGDETCSTPVFNFRSGDYNESIANELKGACGSLVLDNSASKCTQSILTTKDGEGQWKAAAQSQELIQTMRHYYNNTYLDGTKAINMSFIRRSQSDTITCGSSICHCRSSLILVVMIIKSLDLTNSFWLKLL
ncbi:hypothetical protein P8452_02967 [Trifolium repens]|nr:hypothetical protein P8452_02967 [Trifolium repens]